VDRDGQGEHAGRVVGGEALGVEALAEEDLPATATSTGTRHSPRCAAPPSTASPRDAYSAGEDDADAIHHRMLNKVTSALVGSAASHGDVGYEESQLPR
jgi:hypothetical protein